MWSHPIVIETSTIRGWNPKHSDAARWFRRAAAPFGDTMWDQSAADALATQETDDRLDLMKWIAARD